MSETSSKLRLIAATTNLHPDDRQLLNDAADELQFLTARAEAAEKACAEWAETSQANYQRAKAAEARIATIERETLERAAVVAEVKITPGLKKALAALEDIFDGEPEWPNNPKKELRWCRSRARRAVEEIRAMIEDKTDG